MKKLNKGWLFAAIGILIFIFITAPRWISFITRTSREILTNRILKKAGKKIAKTRQNQTGPDDNIDDPGTWVPPDVSPQQT